MTTFPRAARGISKSSCLVSAAAALMLAGCSNSVERFAENPSNADPVYTASVPKAKQAAADTDDTIISRPLAGASLAAKSHDYGSNYRKPVYKQQAPRQQAARTPVASGATVRITVGMTLYSIAKANGLTVAELAAANGITPPYAVHKGQVLHIPGVNQAAVPQPPARQQTAQAPAKKIISTAGRHQVASGETLFSLGRKYGVSPYAIADLNGLKHSTTLKLGQPLNIPGGGAIASKEKPAKPVAEAVQTAENVPPFAKPAASAGQVPAPAVAAQPQQQLAEPQQQVAELPAEPQATGMRWPVRGKIISNFGSKPNGLKNEGINIAVPEGTSVRAAESGVVAYSGNELKGYGNLVLIRHEGGWVTAYAHSKELFVKRGDTVKRGDVIAKAGQTGSVSSPQLHFEVRKGATATNRSASTASD